MSGRKLGQFMQDNLFGPLGMDSTAFRITPDMRRRLAKVHRRGADGALTPATVAEMSANSLGDIKVVPLKTTLPAPSCVRRRPLT